MGMTSMPSGPAGAEAIAGDDAEHGRLAGPRGVDAVFEPEQRRRSVIDQAGTELLSNVAPATVAKLDKRASASTP